MNKVELKPGWNSPASNSDDKYCSETSHEQGGTEAWHGTHLLPTVTISNVVRPVINKVELRSLARNSESLEAHTTSATSVEITSWWAIDKTAC